MRRRFALLSIILLAGGVAARQAVSFTPLTDMGTQTYLGFSGGLYPGGSNAMPGDHFAIGSTHTAKVVPLDTSGRPSPSGKIVLLSIGMSNTTQEFCASGNPSPCTSWSFVGQAAADLSVNHSTLVLVNGARGGQDAKTWISPTMSNYDAIRTSDLAPAGLTEAQVEVAWVKEADADPTSSLPAPSADAYVLEGYLGEIVRALKTRYPNLQLVYLSSRIYAGYATSALNPEPYAYESGFAVKWLIEAQIQQMRSGGSAVDPRAGDLNSSTVAPWIGWGPYLWANGANPRSDGLVWMPADFASDGTHPSMSGQQKVGAMLLSFFKSDPLTRSWFLAQGATPVVADFSFSPANPVSGQPVFFSDASAGAPTTWSWSFGDGTGSLLENPPHVFAAAGNYLVTLTASSPTATATISKPVGVSAAASAPVAEFTFIPAAPRPGELVQFLDQSTGGGSRGWDFGDPTSGPANSSTTANPTHAFLSAGTYSVTLTMTNASGSSRKTRDLIVCERCPRLVPFR